MLSYSHLSVFGTFGRIYCKYENEIFNGEQEKITIIRVRIGDKKKSVPRDQRLSSMSKPHDDKRKSSGRILLSQPHTHDRS